MRLAWRRPLCLLHLYYLKSREFCHIRRLVLVLPQVPVLTSLVNHPLLSQLIHHPLLYQLPLLAFPSTEAWRRSLESTSILIAVSS